MPPWRMTALGAFLPYSGVISNGSFPAPSGSPHRLSRASGCAPNAVIQVRAEECLSWVDCGSLPITSRMTAPCRKAAISSNHDENEPPDGGLLLFARL